MTVLVGRSRECDTASDRSAKSVASHKAVLILMMSTFRCTANASSEVECADSGGDSLYELRS